MWERLLAGSLLCAACGSASADIAGGLGVRFELPAGLGNKGSVLLCENGIKNTSVPHFPVPTYADVKDVSGTLTTVNTPWPTATAEVHARLPNTSTEIGTITKAFGGSLAAILGFQKTDKIITIDYIKYRIEPMTSSGVDMGYSRVGVGMRITVDVREGKFEFSGTLQSLAGAVTAKSLKGTISAELIGISSPDVGMAMPFTADLSEAAVNRIIEAMAVVKSKMFDEKTVIQPQLLSRIECEAPPQR